MKTIADLLTAYLHDHVRVAVRDWRRQHRIAAHLSAHVGGMKPGKLDSAAVNGYCEARRAAGAGDGTLRRELGMLVAAFNFAHRERKIAAVPHIRLPERPASRDLWLTELETDDLLRAAVRVKSQGRVGWRGWLFTHIAAETAARRASIEELRWEQVDLEARLIRFLPAGRVQTKKRRVPVPISDRLLPALQEAALVRSSEYVLGDKSECVRAFRLVCRDAALSTGNAKFLDLYPHALRHTWACLAMRANVDPYQVAGVMGDDLTTVLKNYAHHCPQHLRAAVNFRTPVA